MKEALDWLKTQAHPLVLVLALGVVVWGVVHTPEWMADKLGRLLDHAWQDPTGAAAVVSIVGGAVVAQLSALWIAWRRDPNTPTTGRRSSSTGGHALLDVLFFVAAVAGVYLAAISLHGCSPSELQVQATLASGAGAVIDEGCSLVRHQRDVEQNAAVDANETREAAAAAVAAVRDAWDPFVFACNLAVDAQRAWVGFLVELVARGAEFRLALAMPFIAGTVHAYDDFLALDPPLPEGVTLPHIDASVLSLLDSLTPTEGAE